MLGHYYENEWATSFQTLPNSTFMNHHKIQVNEVPISYLLQAAKFIHKQPTVPQMAIRPTFCGTQNFSSPLLILSHLNHPNSCHSIFLRLILILSYQIRVVLSSGLFPPGFPTKTYDYSSPPYVPHALPIPSSWN